MKPTCNSTRPNSAGPAARGRSERGVALIAVLAFLVLLGLIAGGLMMAVNSDHKLVQKSLGGDQALNVAQAGVAEAIERIRSGEIPATPDPNTVAQIYLCATDELPAFGKDTVALATWQSPTDPLLYSTPGRSDDALTVRFRMDAGRGLPMRFDEQRTPAIQSLSGVPIYTIRSTGRDGDNHATIDTDVARAPVHVHDLDLRAAVVSGFDVRLDTRARLCGYDHRGDTPAWTGLAGRDGPSGCDADPAAQQWERGVAVDDRPGAWSAIETGPQTETLAGNPQPYLEHAGRFYSGCWDVLGLSESDFRGVLGRARRTDLPRRFTGIAFYTGATRIENVDGEGLLYVEGDLELHGTNTFRGLVYATGHVVIDGPCWVLGSVIGAGGVRIDSRDGTVAVLYSHEAIVQGFDQNASRFVQLSWREE